ncbi:hypothetical protein I4U23_020605 [Adineta vaga]|nr:hypothetical protein I4U23_020605 [Adineta vaga]
MSKLHANQSRTNLNSLLPITNGSNNVKDYSSFEKYITFNIFGKLYHVKQSLFDGTSFAEQFYDKNRQQYVIDISPLIFEKILEYYKTQKLDEPTNIHIDYFLEVLESFHIDTSLWNIDARFERSIPRQSTFQLLHVLLEYPDSCRFARILHYICSMVALLSCLLVSLSLTFRDPNMDLHHRSSKLFIIDILCLIWTIGEIVLRLLSTPSLYTYCTTLGLFDIIGTIFHSIHVFMIGTGIKSHRCHTNPIDDIHLFSCITFNRRLMIVNVFRKVRLVRYIRPLKHFLLSLFTSKKEVLRLIVLISFIISCLAPLIFIIESISIHQCFVLAHTPVKYCIQTINDAFYYLILIISTVGYGDIYPRSHVARFIAILAPLSMMMLSVPLSSIYSKYISQREIYRMQLIMPENIRYLVYNDAEFIENLKQSI